MGNRLLLPFDSGTKGPGFEPQIARHEIKGSAVFRLALFRLHTGGSNGAGPPALTEAVGMARLDQQGGTDPPDGQ
jgi:hypothetical protein